MGGLRHGLKHQHPTDEQQRRGCDRPVGEQTKSGQLRPPRAAGPTTERGQRRRPTAWSPGQPATAPGHVRAGCIADTDEEPACTGAYGHGQPPHRPADVGVARTSSAQHGHHRPSQGDHVHQPGSRRRLWHRQSVQRQHRQPAHDDGGQGNQQRVEARHTVPNRRAHSGSEDKHGKWLEVTTSYAGPLGDLPGVSRLMPHPWACHGSTVRARNPFGRFEGRYPDG